MVGMAPPHNMWMYGFVWRTGLYPQFLAIARGSTWGFPIFEPTYMWSQLSLWLVRCVLLYRETFRWVEWFFSAGRLLLARRPKVATRIETHPEFLAAMACKLSQRLIFCRCPWNVMTCSNASFGTVSMEKWQRRSDRLEGLLRRVRCPRLETFEANGEVYQLPLRASAPRGPLSPEELEYLCGNFDGDGCVSMNKSNGRITLSLAQAIDRADILMRFRDALGGGIYRDRDANGFHAASLRWIAMGHAAQHAASILSRFPSMKQAQLLIAAEAAKAVVPLDSRQDMAHILTVLKARTYSPPQGTLRCTWHYFAGFFDAEGSITIRAQTCSMYLTVSQVNRFVLGELLSFLQGEGFEHWKLYQDSTGASMLRCMHFATAKSCLSQLLASKLTLKRSQAQASVTLTPENHSVIREFVSKLNGLQSFYARLDETGIQKAKEIRNQQVKIRRLRNYSRTEDCNNSLLEVAEAELQKLQGERALCKVMSRCDKLRRQARKLLGQGATLMPI